LDGLFQIPTLDEVINHMNFMKSTYTRKVGSAAAPGLYIELKEPSWYASFDVDIVGEVYNGLAAHGLETIQGATDAGIPIIIQSFDGDALKRFGELSDLPLVQLMHHGD
jgi:glycerophosphoryl diester phosphodiesterase